jgi:hypothetical protein
MRHTKAGSERYFDLMGDAATAAPVVREKTNSLISEADTITDVMPDGD